MMLQPGKRSQSIEPRRMSRLAWIRIGLLAVILATFGRSVLNEFVDWDDGRLIYLNPYINNPTLEGISHHWNPTDRANTNMYNPLVFTVWWLIAHGAQLQYPDIIGGTLNPEVYHATNLIVHWLTVLVVLEILRTIGLGDLPAAAGALIFAVHPLQTESVVWATALKDLLSGLFYMLTIWRYLVAMEQTGADRRNNYLLATICCFAAMLAKPSAVVLPLVVAAFDLFLYRRPLRGTFLRIFPWLVGSLLLTGIAHMIQPTDNVYPVALWQRPLIAADALAFYLYKLVLPLRLSFDYGRSPAEVITDPALHHPLYWTWIFPLAAALLIWRSRLPRLWVAGLVFLLGVLPVLGLMPFVYQFFSTVADRYVYPSMLGVAIVVAVILTRYGNRVVWSGLGVVAAIFCCLSFLQAGVWKDSETLYQHGIDLNRVSDKHFMVLAQYKDRLAEAATNRAKADRAAGDLADERIELQRVHEDVEQAIDGYYQTIKLNPLNQAVYDQLGYDLAQMHRFPEAIRVTRQRMSIQDKLAPSQRIGMDVLHKTLGMLYMQTRQYAQAAHEFQESLKIKPDPEIQDMLKLAEQQLPAASRPSG